MNNDNKKLTLTEACLLLGAMIFAANKAIDIIKDMRNEINNECSQQSGSNNEE